GVSLRFGERVFGDPGSVVVPTIRFEDGEQRDKAIGLVGNRLWTAVFVRRGATIRFISLRKSNETEIRGYHRYSGRSG
ncbi:BrnT family toxin, partial [uncultured Sphingomonas sp.]|uniref:BrnT family toxin n=1 Tax=uncultured Sphingomonas sp. TaxID=158754 RepID=UPI0035CA837E